MNFIHSVMTDDDRIIYSIRTSMLHIINDGITDRRQEGQLHRVACLCLKD